MHYRALDKQAIWAYDYGVMNHLSLFSGIGGIDLAAEWAGFRTIAFCEIDPYCQKVLRKHWPDVPIVEDIRDVTKEKVFTYTKRARARDTRFRQNRQGTTNVRTQASEQINGTTIPSITLITGGFPCQPVSVAGKQRGKEDDRWLWPEMLRVIQEIKPTWVVGENVAGLIRMELDDCVSDLVHEGYEVQTFLIPACAVNAPHRRDRVFIVGHAKELHSNGGDYNSRGSREVVGQIPESGDTDSKADVADTEDTDRRGPGRKDDTRRGNKETRGCGVSRDRMQHWATEPDVGRVAHGVPKRVDRLRCLGNAVVPAQIYPILKAIADIEKSKTFSAHVA